MKARDVFISALRRGETPRRATGSATSVATVDLMEKTGAYFPEAHLDADVMARLAEAGLTVLGFDNIMPLCSVCHESAAMGCDVDWGKRDLMPTIRKPLYRMGEEIRIPADLVKRKEARVPLAAIGILKKRHGGEAAIVGKVFGPWTLGYHVFGVQEFLISTILAPDDVKRAMDTLKEATVAYARAQIEAGADALCLADHATRDLCSPDMYRDFLKDIHAELTERIACPLILHICGDTADRIGYIRDTGVACFHFDSKVNAAEARALAGGKLSLMGGTSNFRIIREGGEEEIAAEAAEKLAAGIDIIGPECAVPLDAPYANMQALVAQVKRQERSGA